MPEINLKKYIQKLSRHDLAHHLMRRFLTLPIAITFVFLYSSRLGLERRGVVTGLLTITMVSSMFISKGISLPVRLMQIKLENLPIFRSLLTWLVLGSFVSQILLSLCFFYLTSFFNWTLFALALFLAQLQGIQYFLSDIMFSKGEHRTTVNIESLSVILQFILFMFLGRLNLSVASSIFLAFISSSLIAILFLYRLLITHIAQDQREDRESEVKVFINRGILWSFATTIHTHLERLIVLAVLGFSDFARYSMCTAFFIAIRSFGDVTNRFLSKPIYLNIGSKFRLLLLLVVPTGLGLVVANPFLLLVERVLDESWLVPSSVVAFGVLNESLRLTIYGESIRQQGGSNATRRVIAYISVLLIAVFTSIYLHFTQVLLDFYDVMSLLFLCNFALLLHFFLKKTVF